MGKHPRRWLAKTARAHQRIIEVGVWKGRSTRIIAENTPGHVWAVDHWQGTPWDPAQHALYEGTGSLVDVRTDFIANMATVQNVTVVEMDSTAAARFLLDLHGRSFDWVFIDADHSYTGVLADIAAFTPLLVEGGLLSGHDYKPAWPGVMRAVDEIFGSDAVIGPKSIWSVRV